MPVRFKIAFRNTFRNRRRSLLNIVMIAGGVIAVILFRGFSYRILYDIREKTIETQSGHLDLAAGAYWDDSAKAPKDTLLPEFRKLADAVAQNPHVRYVAARPKFYGLLSVEDKSLSARGLSLDPVAEKLKSQSLTIVEGHGMTADKPFELLIGAGLAKKLGLKAGGSVTVLAYTFDNVINALDLEVGGVFRSGLSEVDDTTFMIPFVTTQQLLDTDKAQVLVVGLDKTENTGLVASQLSPVVHALNPGIVIKTWDQLSDFYRQVSSFFRTQNGIIEIILLALLLLGVLNTIGMSVFERAGEIGTIRALGEPESAIFTQFLIEGALLGIAGAAVGAAAGTLLAVGLTSLGLLMVVPGASRPIHIHIDLFPTEYFIAIGLAFSAAVLATIGPAMRAARLNIVDALRKNV